MSAITILIATNVLTVLVAIWFGMAWFLAHKALMLTLKIGSQELAVAKAAVLLKLYGEAFSRKQA